MMMMTEILDEPVEEEVNNFFPSFSSGYETAFLNTRSKLGKAGAG